MSRGSLLPGPLMCLDCPHQTVVEIARNRQELWKLGAAVVFVPSASPSANWRRKSAPFVSHFGN